MEEVSKEKQIEMLEEMLDFPNVYRLSEKGIVVIKAILKTVQAS